MQKVLASAPTCKVLGSHSPTTSTFDNNNKRLYKLKINDPSSIEVLKQTTIVKSRETGRQRTRIKINLFRGEALES